MDKNITFQIESRLTSHGVYVDEVVEGSGTYDVTYESLSADNAGIVPKREVGRVINVFRDIHGMDWEGVDIEGTVTDLDGNVKGCWRVRQEWIDELHNGDLTEIEFSQKVIDSIEHSG